MGVNLSAYERGFLGALIDGEGSLIANKNKRTGVVSVRVTIANNSLALLGKAQDIVGAGCVNEIKHKDKYQHRSYVLTFSAGICRDLLPQLEFATIEKEARRKIFIEYLEASNRKSVEPDLFMTIRGTSTNKRLACT